MPLGINLPDLNPLHLIAGPVRNVMLAPVDALANAIGDGLAEMLKTLSTAWISLGTPNVATSGGHATPVVAFLQSETAPYVGLLLLVSLLIGAVRIMLSRHAGAAGDVIRGLITYVVIAGCGTAAVGLLIATSDEFSEAIIDHAAAGHTFGHELGQLVGVTGLGSVFLVIVLGMAATLISVVQIALMVARAGLLVLLVGMLPLAASLTATETGRSWLRKYLGWTLAFVLYKPAAAIVYSAAFRLVSADVFQGDGVLRVIVGLSLMTLAIVALPALLKFMLPATAHIATGAGGGLAGAAAVARAMPTGAKAVPPMVRPNMASAGPTGAVGTGALGAATAIHSHARGAAHRAIGHDDKEGRDVA